MPVFPNANEVTPEDFEALFRRLFQEPEPPTVGRGTLISPLHPAVMPLSPSEALARDHYLALNGETGAEQFGMFLEALRRAQAAVVSRELLATCENCLLELLGYRLEAVSNGGNPVEDADPDAMYQRAHDLTVRLRLVLALSQRNEEKR